MLLLTTSPPFLISLIAESYDFFAKALYVRWEGEKVTVAIPIHKISLKENLMKDEYGAQDMLFKGIVDRIDALLHMLAKENAEALASSVLAKGCENAYKFITNWQAETWERLVSEVVVEMALEEAEEDMSEAIAEHERKLEKNRKDSEAFWA